ITARKMVLHGRFPYLSYPRRYRKEDYEAARRAMERSDAWELADSPVQSLSGGQRQKVYLAMAMAQETQTILMDEPTTYLDIQHQLSLMTVAQQMAGQGTAVVLVLHDLCLALRFSDRCVLLQEGQMVQQGSPEEVFQSGALDQVFQAHIRRVDTPNGWRYYYD
ncbi:MAG: ABC transporter ATP-binding protein, partial [Flintibacter sp.]|uniref:ABC transporter ATP-binding protein n=1 Tax=Flintibacter sp. TaxID=1918624 RepID=UPI002D7F4C2A